MYSCSTSSHSYTLFHAIIRVAFHHHFLRGYHIDFSLTSLAFFFSPFGLQATAFISDPITVFLFSSFLFRTVFSQNPSPTDSIAQVMIEFASIQTLCRVYTSLISPVCIQCLSFSFFIQGVKSVDWVSMEKKEEKKEKKNGYNFHFIRSNVCLRRPL